MIGRIVEVAAEGRFLGVHRGFLVVNHQGEEIGRVPLDDVQALIVHGHGTTLSNNLLVALSERQAPVVFCAANHLPTALLWPAEGYYQQARRMDAQLEATKPLRKRIWQQLVKAKVRQQASVLEAFGLPPGQLNSLAAKVRSGDPDNIEAQAARAYWPLLFGESFRRDPSAGGTNSLLNYGYTVLRAATARSVMAAGLHPTIGIHHSNRGNPMRLVDDLMEVFRPIVDAAVAFLVSESEVELTAQIKKSLVRVSYLDLPTTHGRSPLVVCLERAAASLGEVFEGAARKLDLPEPSGALVYDQVMQGGLSND